LFERGENHLIKPYLPRISRGIIADWSVSDRFFDAQRVFYGLNSPAPLALDPHSKIKDYRTYGAIEIKRPKTPAEISKPYDVIARQEQLADFAFSFDFPITFGMSEKEKKKHFRLTLANAVWMLENKRRRNLVFFAVVQGWDTDSYRRAARELAGMNFGGIAVGGLQQFGTGEHPIRKIVEAVKGELPDLPLHPFGTAPHLAGAFLDEKLISSATATIEKLIKTRKEMTAADVPEAICRIAESNRIALPLSAYRLTKRE
jgi:Queuine tRNA-ribosyltransferase